MTIVLDPFMASVPAAGIQRGRGGFYRSKDGAPYVSDPSGDLCKTGARKGEPKRVKYGSPSNAGTLIENDVGLTKHKQRKTFLGIGMSEELREACKDLALMEYGTEEFNTAADTIVVQADTLTRAWLAADRGSHGHLICELVDKKSDWPSIIEAGIQLDLSEDTQIAVAIAWGQLLAANGLEILAVESSCVDDQWRLAGTLDRIVRTTKPLTFVKPGGEIVVVPADIVIVLDLKFGACRKAHPIQIASYAQSVPYDTETEQRGVWPWPIDQTHALIAHGDFGDDLRPPSIELVWVDLVAGREHGGQCVVDAKAWAARDDVFSVAQIVEGDGVGTSMETGTAVPQGFDSPPAAAPSTLSPVPPVPVAGEVEGDSSFTAPPSPALSWCDTCNNTRVISIYPDVPCPDCSRPSPDDCDPHGIPRPPRLAATAAGEGVGPSPAPSPAYCSGEEVEALPGCRWGKPDDAKALPTDISQGRDVTPEVGLKNEAPARAYSTTPPDPARLALVDARAALCDSPDEGADWSSDESAPLWEELRGLFDDLDGIAKGWRSELAGQAKRRHVDFLAQGGKTERRYWINKAVICLALAGFDDRMDDILRELLSHIIGDVALMLGVEPGHALGSLSAAEAARFAAHVDQYLSPLPSVA